MVELAGELKNWARKQAGREELGAFAARPSGGGRGLPVVLSGLKENSRSRTRFFKGKPTEHQSFWRLPLLFVLWF